MHGVVMYSMGEQDYHRLILRECVGFTVFDAEGTQLGAVTDVECGRDDRSAPVFWVDIAGGSHRLCHSDGLAEYWCKGVPMFTGDRSAFDRIDWAREISRLRDRKQSGSAKWRNMGCDKFFRPFREFRTATACDVHVPVPVAPPPMATSSAQPHAATRRATRSSGSDAISAPRPPPPSSVRSETRRDPPAAKRPASASREAQTDEEDPLRTLCDAYLRDEAQLEERYNASSLHLIAHVKRLCANVEAKADQARRPCKDTEEFLLTAALYSFYVAALGDALSTPVPPVLLRAFRPALPKIHYAARHQDYRWHLAWLMEEEERKRRESVVYILATEYGRVTTKGGDDYGKDVRFARNLSEAGHLLHAQRSTLETGPNGQCAVRCRAADKYIFLPGDAAGCVLICIAVDAPPSGASIDSRFVRPLYECHCRV